MKISRYKTIVSVLTLTMFVFSTIFTPLAYALTTGTDEATTNKAVYTTGNPAYTFNMQNISNVLPAIVGCTGIVNKVKKFMLNTFDGGAGVLEDSIPVFKAGTGNYKAGYDDGNGSADPDGFTGGYAIEAVPINSTQANKDTSKIDTSTEKSAKEAEQKKLKDECLNGVAYALAKAQLASITNKTVNWINSGFNGDPLFIRDRESYFKSLGDQTLQSLLGPLSSVTNATIYPFGADFARTAILSAKTSFLDRSKSTLTNSLKPGATTDSFATDFSQGGWDGWFSLTQNPQNNPLGFGILASQELADKTNAKKQGAKEELDQGDGFLSQKRCVEYAKVDNGTDLTTTSSKNYSVVSNDPNTRLTGFYINTNSVSLAIKYNAGETGTMAASITDASGNSKGAQTLGKTKKGENNLGTTFNSLSASSSYKIKFAYQPDAGSEKEIIIINITTTDKTTGNQTPDRSTNTSTTSTATPECVRWETVTPGTVIADQLKVNLGSSVRQLELADSLNESLSAVFEALVNQLINQGLSSLSKINSANTNGLGGAGSNKVYDTGGNNVSGKLLSEDGAGVGLSINKGTGWYNVNNTFDITKDLGDTYKMEKGKKVVIKKGIISIQSDYITAVKSSMKELDPIIPALGELDYCIPGPNPKWKSLAVPNVNNTMEILRNIESGKVTPSQLTGYGKALPFLRKFSPGFKISENIYRITSSRRLESEAKQLDQSILDSIFVSELLMKFNIKLVGDQYISYRNKMDELYGPNSPMRDATSEWYLPMAEAGLNLTKNLIAYDQSMGEVISDYTSQINQTNANIYKLNQIKKKVDAIVLAAKKRQLADIRSGKIKLSPECANLAPQDTNVVNGGIYTGNNTGTGTNTGPSGGTTVKFKSPVPNFTVTTKEDLSNCTFTLQTKNTSTDTVGPYRWDISWGAPASTGGATPEYSMAKDLNMGLVSNVHYGDMSIKLTISDIFGQDVSITKKISTQKRTKTLSGEACPR